jgi:hypothetical protein
MPTLRDLIDEVGRALGLDDAPERDWAKRPVEELAPMAFRTVG